MLGGAAGHSGCVDPPVRWRTVNDACTFRWVRAHTTVGLSAKNAILIVEVREGAAGSGAWGSSRPRCALEYNQRLRPDDIRWPSCSAACSRWPCASVPAPAARVASIRRSACWATVHIFRIGVFCAHLLRALIRGLAEPA
jgi:hypothetical protein